MIWLLVLLCLLISFTFSGIEAGVFSVNRVRLEHRLSQGDKAAVKLQRLLAKPERLLVTILIVTNVMNICAVILGTQALVRSLGVAGYGVSFLLFLPVYTIGLELLPKSLFRRFPYRALAYVSELLRITDLILSPLLAIGSKLAKVILPKGDGKPKKLFGGREDFKYLTTESERVGTLSTVERRMIHNVVDFRTVTARDVMVPMESVRTIPAGSRMEDLLQLSRESHMERFPVVSPRGEVLGLVNVVELLLDGVDHGGISGGRRRIVHVSPEEQAYGVVRKMRAARLSLAVVTDKDGKALGIVSSEDLLRRLVSVAVA